MSKQYDFPEWFHPENKPQLHNLPNRPVQLREKKERVQSQSKYVAIFKEELIEVDFDYLELEEGRDGCDDGEFVLYKDVVEINDNYEKELQEFHTECDRLTKENKIIQERINEFNQYYKLHNKMISEIVNNKIKEMYGDKNVKSN